MQKKKRALALLLTALVSLTALAGCGTRLDKTSELLKYKDSDRVDAIGTLCGDYFEENGLVGLSVSVLVDGHVKFFNYGVTEEGGAAVTEDTRFDLGTLTQVFTGVTYGESIYRRYLSDSSSLKGMFPYLNIPLWEAEDDTQGDGEETKAESITYGQLATHRSGLPAAPANLPDEQAPYAFYDELALRRYLSTAQLEARPGTRYSPDGMDMGLLGFALEVARKTPFEQHVKNVVMYSISMTRTTITFPEDDDSHLASWATPHDAEGSPLPHQEYSALQGMAAFKSTAYDMTMFAWANMNMPGTENTFTKEEAGGWTQGEQLYLAVDDKPLADETYGSTTRERFGKLVGAQSVVERLYAGMTIAQEEHYSDGNVSLGYGYHLGGLGGSKYIWQTGGDAGNGGYLGFVPDTATAVVVLTNTADDVQGLGEAILALVNQ